MQAHKHLRFSSNTKTAHEPKTFGPFKVWNSAKPHVLGSLGTINSF